MDNLRFAGDDDEDLYSGFDSVHPALDTRQLDADQGFQEAVRTSYGRRPPTQSRAPTTAARLTSAAGIRLGTGQGTALVLNSSVGQVGPGSSDGLKRPMTSMRGTGYTSQSNVFDPLNQASKGPAPALISKTDESPEEKIKSLERRVMGLIEESCMAASRGEIRLALDRAKEASSKERSLIRQREQAGLSDGHNLDLTFSVLFNLANQYAANDMYTEALNTYQVITKDRMFNNSGRLRVNMGNIHYKMGQYNKAIKFYRMALDQVPNTHKSMRIKIMHNIGLVFVKMAQYSEACTSFEYIMQEEANFKTGLDLVTAYYALGDKEKMKKGFLRLLECQLDIDDDEKYTTSSEDTQSNLILEVIRNDPLRKMERQMKQEAERSILTAAKLISPVIENTFSEGYNWCVDAIKNSQYADLANDLEINKAVMFLRQKNFKDAVETLKMFEKKETKVASTAATNLSFLYFLQNEIDLAEKYALMARDSNGYNDSALVNLGNCCFNRKDYEKAREHYIAALDIDASCVEALYNLGLTNKKLGRYDEALDSLLKMHAIVRNYPPVVYQIASLYQELSDIDQASEWYLQLLGLVPTDPHIHQRLGQLFDSEGDKQQAYQYYFDSYRYFPSNLEVIDWLGSYFIEHQVAEKAISYFERAALMQPDEVKWQLMTAACHRRSGSYQQALQTYKQIHRRFPENIECLKLLIRLSSDLGLKEAAEYAQELKKAERAQEQRESRAASGSRPGSRRSSSRASRSGSAASGHEEPGALPPKSPGPGARASSRGSRSIPGSAMSGRMTRLSLNELDENEPFVPSNKEVDSSYVDPLGPLQERPKTSMRRKQDEDDFADEELGDDLLPE
ncbi:intraflagellar transport protein 88 homolog isoform X1 [Penaeus japonicus]|uniref:intraflagellar transport protein 88 homolog isoform X1 n=1 Tax=Penaeus japonicus TaxID=27405 RepID=UPI001C70BFC5|nr:intraflagellar transport protein 88 homolog isoform X1 [Penaeus japonicus]XP_042866440.1 intraflagellar transport protein 88 homolog isoform X1 [Penaeus japonicus]